jgi:threonylcarbamoyladenosine tRNA methylthiotransferase MtaB
MKVHLKTLGCRLNEAELETWTRDFHARGHQMTGDVEQAELVVINTCAVTDEAVKKSRKLLRRAQRANPAAKLVVSGCYASLEAEATQAIQGVDLVVPNTEKNRLVEIVHDKLALPAGEAALDDNSSLLLFSGRQRAFIKVQDGCRYRCTYCIVTLARGEESSRGIDDIIAEINLHQAQGISEVVLTGVHLGGYGSDRDLTLADLVRAVLERTSVPRIRLGSLEPWELDDAFWLLFENPRLMPHLHLPLQSGADSVLRRMSRRCRTDEFAGLIDKALKANPHFNITTDIIVGFPGETEQEWQTGLDFISRIPFGHIHVFAFSPREGTKAATLPDPVSRDTKRERSQQLHDLAEQLKASVLKSMPGQEADILIEANEVRHDDGTITWTGYTPHYHRVYVTSTEDGLTNRIRRVKIEALENGNELTGRLI